MNTVLRSVLIVFFTASPLLGCGGGSHVRSSPDAQYDDAVPPIGSGGQENGAFEPPGPGSGSAPSQNRWEGLRVPVAVIDTEFRVTHEEFDGVIVDQHNLLGADGAMGPGPVNHGTPVAALVAGNRLGHGENAGLILIRASDNLSTGAAYDNVLREGIALAAKRGARVANVSFSGAQYFLSGGGSETALRSVVRSANNGLGTAIVVAAGNRSEQLSYGWLGLHPQTAAETPATPKNRAEAIKEDDPILEQTVIVGGHNAGGTNLASGSAYPGSLSWLQDRFIMAPFTARTASGHSDTGTTVISGTSASAAIVSGMLATLLNRWPHLEATEVTELLLDTADRTAPQYNDNRCGPNEDVNCGYYFFGQGFADPDAALRPTGTLSVPTGDRVDGVVVPLSAMGMTLGGAWGDALVPAALDGMVAFDELGRDYGVASEGLVQRARGRTGERVERLAQAWPAERAVSADLGGGFGFESHLNPNGTLAGERVLWDGGRIRAGAFHFYEGPEGMPGRQGRVESLGLLSDGQSGLWADLGRGLGIDGRLVLNDNHALYVVHWAADGESGYGQARTEFDWRSRPFDWLEVSLGYGQDRESGGVLGARGIADGLALERIVLGARLDLPAGIDLHAHMEQGRGAIRGSDLVQRVEGLRTERARIGIGFGDGEYRGALVLGRPLRMTGGTARLDLPVGRDIDGTVLREQRSVTLRPSGSQTDLEAVYAFPAGRDGRIQVNILHSRDAGHVAGSHDSVGSINYSLRF